MKKITFYISYIFLCTSLFAQEDVTDSINEITYYEMFLKAKERKRIGDTVYVRYSTASYYIVINVINIKTGEKKEICTLHSVLENALAKDSGNTIINEELRLFSFRSEESLQTIGFYNFTAEDMDECIGEITADSLLDIWRKDKILFSNTFSGKCQVYYAYILFKHGIMTKRGSVFYIDDLHNTQ